MSAEPALFTDPRRLIVDGQQAKAARQRQLAELFAGPLELELSARTSEPGGARLQPGDQEDSTEAPGGRCPCPSRTSDGSFRSFFMLVRTGK
jgi:hypothetical protein